MALDKDDIKQLIAILQKGLTDDEEVEEYETPIKTTSPKQTKKKITNNLFDSMAESRMHKEDVEIDRKLNKLPPTERSRNYRPIQVRCRVCGREESLNPALVESIERHKCNRCSTSSG